MKAGTHLPKKRREPLPGVAAAWGPAQHPPVAQRAMKVCACFLTSSSLAAGSGSRCRMCGRKSLGITDTRSHLSFSSTSSSQCCGDSQDSALWDGSGGSRTQGLSPSLGLWHNPSPGLLRAGSRARRRQKNEDSSLQGLTLDTPGFGRCCESPEGEKAEQGQREKQSREQEGTEGHPQQGQRDIQSRAHSQALPRSQGDRLMSRPPGQSSSG